jgi:FkbM family methyltransferase
MAEVLTLHHGSVSWRMYDPGGGGRVAKIQRTGTPYEVDVLRDIASLGLSGVAVDAGANRGNHSLFFAIVCGMRVVAFEPLRVPELTANVALNSVEEQVQIHPVALGAEQGTATCHGKGCLTTGGGRPARRGGEYVGKQVPVRRLDSYNLDDVTLLKIDVEGMEAAVIRGGLDTIRRNRPVIYAEAWDDGYSAATGELLKPLGYTMTRRFRWHQQRWEPRSTP